MAFHAELRKEIVDRLNRGGHGHLLSVPSDADRETCYKEVESVALLAADVIEDCDTVSFVSDNSQRRFDFVLNTNDRYLGHFTLFGKEFVGRPCEGQTDYHYVDIFLKDEGRDFFFTTLEKVSVDETAEAVIETLLKGSTKFDGHGLDNQSRFPVFNGSGPLQTYEMGFDDDYILATNGEYVDFPPTVEADSLYSALYEYMRIMDDHMWELLETRSELYTEREFDCGKVHVFERDSAHLKGRIEVDGVTVECIYDDSFESEHMMGVYLAGQYSAAIGYICDLMPEVIAKERISKAIQHAKGNKVC